MKLESLLTRIAAVSLVAVLTGLVFNTLALALFAAAASAFVLLIASGDYARRRRYALTPVAAPVSRSALPLAA